MGQCGRRTMAHANRGAPGVPGEMPAGLLAVVSGRRASAFVSRRMLQYYQYTKAKLRSLLIRELAHLLPRPYWQTRLASPFSKGETGLGTLATFFPPHSCPSMSFAAPWT
jgi:hypothetical protein